MPCQTTHCQYTFNPVKYTFNWTADGWYAWDREAAHKAARLDRDAAAKRLKAQGRLVHKSTLGNQLITLGGIGTDHPEIGLCVSVYLLDVV